MDIKLNVSTPWVWHVLSTAHDGSVAGIQWTKGTSTAGSADISATIKGRSVKIEVKIGKDRQSEAQKKYQ
jgi:hypothetical protein